MRAWPGHSSRRRIAIAAALVVACHLALIAVLNASAWRRAPPAQAASAQRVTLRLIAAVPNVPSPPAALAPSREPASPARRAPRDTAVRISSIPIITTAPSGEPATSTALAAPMPPASAPDAPTSLMDTDATRRAIRQIARAPSLGDQLAQSREEPRRLSAHDRLAIGVREGGKGDCLKGEYAGAGMGILSLPFLAVAAAAGNCAK